MSRSSSERCLWADDDSQVSECASQVSKLYGEHGDYSYDVEPERENSDAEAFDNFSKAREPETYNYFEEGDGGDQGGASPHVYESLSVGHFVSRCESAEVDNSTNSRRYALGRDSSMSRPRSDATDHQRRESSGFSSRLDYSLSGDESEYEDGSCQNGSEDGSSLAYSYGGESLSHAEKRGSLQEEDRYHVASPTPAKSEGATQRSPTDPMEFERLISESLPPDEYYNQLTNRGKLAYHQVRTTVDAFTRRIRFTDSSLFSSTTSAD